MLWIDFASILLQHLQLKSMDCVHYIDVYTYTAPWEWESIRFELHAPFYTHKWWFLCSVVSVTTVWNFFFPCTRWSYILAIPFFSRIQFNHFCDAFYFFLLSISIFFLSLNAVNKRTERILISNKKKTQTRWWWKQKKNYL